MNTCKIEIVYFDRATYPRIPCVMSWSDYLVFSQRVAGEGIDWKAVIC